MRCLTIESVSTALLTDLGRKAGGKGLSGHGALDQGAAKLANTLVGNDVSQPVVEMTMSAFSFRAHADALFAVAGAYVSVHVDGCPVPPLAPFSASKGQFVQIGSPSAGLRTYLSARGSFVAQEYLGSCAPDPMIGFGRPLSAGDSLQLRLSTPSLRNPMFDVPLIRLGEAVVETGAVPRGYGAFHGAARPVVIQACLGPDASSFSEGARTLWSEVYEMLAKSNAVGIRASGATPARLDKSSELVSSGVPPGAVEVPGPGELIVLHRSCGITAGYAVPAVVTSSGLDVLAQLRPGDEFKFRRVPVEQAVSEARKQARALAALRGRVLNVLRGHGVT